MTTADAEPARLLHLVLDRIASEPSASSIDRNDGSFGWVPPMPSGQRAVPVRVRLSAFGLAAIYDDCADMGIEMMNAGTRDEGFIRWLFSELDEGVTFNRGRLMVLTDDGKFVAGSNRLSAEDV